MGVFNRLVNPGGTDKDRERNAASGKSEKDAAVKAAQARQKEQAKLNMVGKPRSTDFMDAEIPQGHHSEKTGDGRYVIRKD